MLVDSSSHRISNMNKIILILLLVISPNISFANERFIPVELWLGGEISGASDITFPETDFSFGYKGRHTIQGPINWKNPQNGKNIKVYDRSRYSKKAGKIVKQLWTVTNNNQCLGRVFDNRRNKFIKNGCKFPLGNWKEGESRSFTSQYYDKTKGTYQRIKTIKILELGTNKKSCLKFRWEMTQNGSPIDDNTYEYCYKEGLVKVNGKNRF
jgi:hypothetical protein